MLLGAPLETVIYISQLLIRMEHRLKILPQFFSAVVSGEKTFELRKNDRDFKVGDDLLLCEWTPDGFTGNEFRCHINYILEGYDGLSPDYVILSIVPARNRYRRTIGAHIRFRHRSDPKVV